MKTHRNRTLATLLLMVALLLALVAPGATYGQKEDDQGGGQQPNSEPIQLTPRVVYPKPAKPVVARPEDAKLLVLKFAEGTHIRLRDGQMAALLDQITPAQEELLKRAQIAKEQIQPQLDAVHKLLAQYSTQFDRLFTRDEGKLEHEKREGELNSGEELADLNLYYYLFPPGDVATSEQLLAELLSFSIVETAYAQPPSEEAQADLPPTTPSFVARQGYLREADTIFHTNGVAALHAWTHAGGRGDNVRVVDVELGWNLAHEDLNPRAVFYRYGEFVGDGQHGTAVLGVIVGAENSYGVTGIVPNAQIGVAGAGRYSPSGFPIDNAADALNHGAEPLRAGDILLIEQHRRGPASGETCVQNCRQFEYIALEYWQANFDAIRNATARNIIVVEAAGNGSMNLDHDRYEGRFRRPGEHPLGRDSGAIIVGAGFASNRAPHVWSNAGSRVDVQGWGDSVMTLGYGEPPAFRINGDGDANQWYRPDFGGTSSASPIVVGAAASLQGIHRAAGRPVFNSFQMRELLRATGTPQSASARQIGPLPNLRAALNRIGLGTRRPTTMRLVTVRESDRDVDIPLDVQPGDWVTIEAVGEIWSGEYYTGWLYGIPISYPYSSNGPEGLFGFAQGAGFPLRGVSPYSLLAKLGSGAYFRVGRAYEFLHTGAPQRLYLRINDHTPGNGNGEFGVLVQIYR